MYTINCRCRKHCMCHDNTKNDVYEDICDDVAFGYDTCVDECKCGFDEEENLFTNYPMLGHAYVPKQKMNKTFTPCVGLKMGTIFPELVSPYEANQSMEEAEFLRQANEIKEGCNDGCV